MSRLSLATDMPNLIIVADIYAEPDRADFVATELKKLVAPTLAEEGCLQYDLHRDNQDPAHFLFYETWTNRDLWQAHMKSAHLAAYSHATEGAVRLTTIFEMTKDLA